jgi:hypothetical protein
LGGIHDDQPRFGHGIDCSNNMARRSVRKRFDDILAVNGAFLIPPIKRIALGRVLTCAKAEKE